MAQSLTGSTAATPARLRVIPIRTPTRIPASTWNEAQFKDPKAKIPGTKMVFAGIKNEKEAGELWSFLAQYGKDRKAK